MVSRAFVEATAQQVRALCERDLSAFALVVLLMDGIAVGDTVQVVALGIDGIGTKQILGFRQGATEKADGCGTLLKDLVARGLQPSGPLLVVLDGAKALRAAVQHRWGRQVVVQRCQYHKRQNVKKHLPAHYYHAEYDRKLQAAYKMRTYQDAREALIRIQRELARLNPSAMENFN